MNKFFFFNYLSSIVKLTLEFAVSDELIITLEQQVLANEANKPHATDLNESLKSLRNDLTKMHDNIQRLTDERQAARAEEKLAAEQAALVAAQEAQNAPELDHAFSLVCSLSGIEVHEIEYTETEAIYKCSQGGKYGGKYTNCCFHMVLTRQK